MASKSLVVLSACIIIGSAVPVEKLPVLKSQPAEVLFRESQPTVLECIIEGQEEGVKYTWTKDGKDFKWTEHNAAQRTNEGSLVFLSPQPSDEGHYQCFAQTAAGVASSRVISFKRTYLVAEPAKTHEKTPVEGKPFQLDCVIPNAYPKPEIFWKKSLSGADPNADSANLGRRVTAGPDGNLYFTTVEKEDVSDIYKYVCVAKSPAHDGEVRLVEYIIKEVTKDTSGYKGELVPQYLSKDIVAKVGSVTMIYCMYGGKPQGFPDYFKDGKDVNGDAGGRITRHNRTSGKRLLIKETLLEDQGTYTCEESNGVGKPVKHSLKVTVVSAPKYVKSPEKVIIAKQGQDVTIPCQVTGLPAPKVTWTHNAQPLSGGKTTVTESGLIIKGLQKGDKGYYGCRSTNEHGDEYVETLVQVN
uniref:Hemolin n=1 Tax=Lonomia obliqua TaxID=304329 RepID=LOSAC_LONON|nr:RecName: Full=Hemolin; AltName: Full=Lonomia obliqua Stuart factor activator; Short=Losac; Flags: Precursor [Lonomia obliqua]ABF21073.1 hemolin [Lonomia obliqua]